MNSRLIAAKILFRVLNDGDSLTIALENSLQTDIPQKEKAFVQALCYGTLRQYYHLDFILTKLLRKPLKNMDVKVLALIGLYQLKFMRVKSHAAVSESVSAVRNKPWAKSLINAVLRRYLREQEDLDALADNCVSAASAHPEWMIKLLEKQWPHQFQQILLENNQQPPMVLRVNKTRLDRDEYVQQLTACGLQASASALCNNAVVLQQPVAVEHLPGFAEGLVSVQDTAAQFAAQLLDVQPGQRVLDVCAAPGGKTTHVLEMQPALDSLLAVDVDANRLLMVRENLQRLSLPAKLIAGDALEPKSWWDGVQFERILLDAPCSALGVIRRHPDIKVLRKAKDIERLTNLQKNILDAMWPLLAPGGLLLYATCSILKQENESQIQAFFNRHDDALDMPIDAAWGNAQAYGRQIITGQSGMDGFYYARICKQ